MFRCKECGCEFDIKPDYCDCGNDTFDEIIEKSETHVEQEPAKEEKMWVEENGFGYPIDEQAYKDFSKNSDNNKQKSEPVIKFEKPNIPQIKIEPVSLTIFLICILLSVFVVFFVGNPKDDVIADKNAESTQITTKNIPSIDKIWDNTLPVKKVDEVIVEEEPVVQQPVQAPQQVEVKKNETKIIQQPVVKTPKQTPSAPVKTTQSPVQPKPQTKTTSTTTSKNNASQPVQVPTQVKTVPQPQVKTSNPQEMINYKIALRNKLASKIDFTSILGDGTCVVSFKVSPSGTLTNRTFVKQSENGILNDVVYNAIMATPTFNSPPSSYNNETLKFTVKMYDGRYEVSLN